MAHDFLYRELTEDEEARAAALHERAIVVDTLGAIHPDDDYLDGLRRGGVTAVALTMGSEMHDFRQVMEKIVHWNSRSKSDRTSWCSQNRRKPSVRPKPKGALP